MKSHRNNLLVGWILLTVLFRIQLVAQNEKQPPRYVIKALSTLGGTVGVGEAINNKGWITGAANLPGDTTQHATLWRRGVLTDLGTLGGPSSRVVGGVKNTRGEVAGGSETSIPDPLGETFCSTFVAAFSGQSLICLGFAWRNGVMIPLPTLGGNNSFAFGGINNRGQIAGFAENAVQDPACTPPEVLDFEAVIWGPKGKIQELPPLVGDSVGIATEVNNHGQAVGATALCSAFVTGIVHAVLWRNGAAIDLGDLGSQIGNWAYAINDRGQVVGAGGVTGGNTWHAFLWQDGKMTDLGVLPGDFMSQANGMNNKGQVVGTSCNDVSFDICHGFLWQDGMMTDLDTLIQPNTSLSTFIANDINDRGEIAGAAIDLKTGASPGFLMIPCDEQHADVEDCKITLAQQPTKYVEQRNAQRSLCPRASANNFGGEPVSGPRVNRGSDVQFSSFVISIRNLAFSLFPGGAAMKFKQFTLLLPLLLILSTSAFAATTWYVDDASGSDANTCLSAATACKTISHAISIAASGDSIRVAAGTYQENLSIGFSLNLVGAGTSATIIDGGGVNTVVTIPGTSARVTLSRLTITHGYASKGGGILNAGILTVRFSAVNGNTAEAHGGSGGGLYNTGTVTISDSTISGNKVLGSAGNCVLGRCAGGAFGGGIYSATGSLTVFDSAVSGNKVVGIVICPSRFRCVSSAWGGGIGINNATAMKLTNSTITGNSVSGGDCQSCVANGGGIFSYGSVSVNNSTVSRNYLPYSNSEGGGIFSAYPYTTTLQNSIIADNSHWNCAGTVTSNGYNLSSDGTCNFTAPGDMNNTDPMLGPLQNNGGPTQTMAPPSGSPAIDAGNPAGCTDGSGHLLTTDQRGKPRPDKEDTGGCDIGAYESQTD